MGLRIVAAAIAGGIVIFIWGAVSHMALPLGHAGIQNLPNDRALLDAFRQHIPSRGLYFFPPLPDESPGMAQSEREQLMNAYAERYRQGPTGILIIDPDGGEVLATTQLLTEFACNVVASLVAALMLSCTLGSLTNYAARVGFVALLGVFASAMSDVQWWNWYNVPEAFAAAAVVDSVVGALLGGAVIAAIVRPVTTHPAPQAADA